MRRLTRRLQPLAASLALLAMALRALLPDGFMPAASVDGISIVLCTGQGAKLGTVDRLTGKPRPEHRQQCPFGFALSMAAVPFAALPDLDRLAESIGVDAPALPDLRPKPAVYRSRAPPVA